MAEIEEQGVTARTVQAYIDETPAWADGTKTSSTPMTRMQWRIWGLATAGKFFEGLVVFMTGVALPLIVKEFGVDALGKGALGAASLFGILVGATALGGLSDHYGRKKMFIVEMIIFVVFLIGLVFSPGYWTTLFFLFGVGLALGCDYPTAHMVISESIPSGNRGRLVLSAFGFQAVGAIVGTGVGFLILHENPHLSAWRWMYATAIVPALLVVIGRFFIPDSPHWLVERGRVRDAERETLRLLRRKPPYPKEVRLAAPNGAKRTNRDGQPAQGSPTERLKSYFRELFGRKFRKATILASVPWFLQDLGTYGIGIFTPTILASILGHESEHASNIAAIIHKDMLAAEGAAIIDGLLLLGIVAAVLLVDKVGRIKLQVAGFIGCAIGLFVASLSVDASGANQAVFIFTGFMLFSFATNIGPNAMTYLLAGEVFPTRIRGKGAGFAASFAKIGAVLTAFLFPVLLEDIGTRMLLYILVGTSLLGAVVTWIYGIETRGVNLETVGNETREE